MPLCTVKLYVIRDEFYRTTKEVFQMSYKRLQDNVRKYNRKLDNLSCTPVILTDSKGRYLRKVPDKRDQTERKIQWLGRSGFNLTNAVDLLSSKKIRSLLRFHNCVHLYIWIGTCDLTSKGRKFIDLRKPTKKTLQVLCRNLDIIKSRCLAHGVQLTFIQIPYYSIQHWNERKGHDNPSIYKENDKRLTQLVNKANDHINCLNNEIYSYSPKLNQDLMRG